VRLLVCVSALALVAAALSVGSAGAQTKPASTLAPKPLAEKTTIKVGVPATVEAAGDIYLAKSSGEFEKENLDAEIAIVPIPDGTALLISGGLDVIQGGVLPPQMNANADGAKLRMIMSGPTFPPSDDFGIWARSGLWKGNKPDPCAFKGKTVSVGGVAGWGSAIAGPFLEFLKQCKLGPKDINLATVAPTDALVAMENGALDAAYLPDPFWSTAQANGAKLAVRYGDATSVGWMVNTEKMDPKVQQAVVRALLRTRRNMLQGDYKHGATLSALTKELGTPATSLQAAPNLLWGEDGRWDPAMLKPTQQAWLDVGGLLTYSKPLPVSKVYSPKAIDAVLKSSAKTSTTTTSSS
jgi:NitT/TauT family transport system substrate-binding protein